MNSSGFGAVDSAIILAYLALSVLIGVSLKRRATQDTGSFFLAGRNVPWWMLGLSGCSSYIDISGTIAVVTVLFYLGAKADWVFHAVWGLFTMAFFMAYQAKYVRRSGVMTFAEWNTTRFGSGRAAETARLALALFVVLLMIFNFTYVAVGIGKFASEFLPFAPWQSTLMIFAAVGVYCSLGGFMGVILTDLFQTVLITVGAVVLSVIAFRIDVSPLLAARDAAWLSAAPSWNLWPEFSETAAPAFAHYSEFGFVLAAALPWLVFRTFAGPNVWDFQFFLTVRSARDASLAAGMWTISSVIRWFIAVSLVVIGVTALGVSGKDFDAERLLPIALAGLPVGLKGMFVAVMLAALMSTLSAMANLLSAVVTNDFVRRYMGPSRGERELVRIGQIVSAVAMTAGFLMSLAFSSVVAVWEVMLFAVVTMILVPATLRWHWWRYGPQAFVWSMAGTAIVCLLLKVLDSAAPAASHLLIAVPFSVVLSLVCGFVFSSADRETLVRFYAKVRPFGVWGPVRRDAVSRGLVPSRDTMPAFDVLNAFLCSAFQFATALIPFYLLFKQWPETLAWTGASAALAVVLYFTWYRTLPPADEEQRAQPDADQSKSDPIVTAPMAAGEAR